MAAVLPQPLQPRFLTLLQTFQSYPVLNGTVLAKVV